MNDDLRVYFRPISVTEKLYTDNSSEVFQKLLLKNASDFSDSDLSLFMSFKENQYEERRITLKQFCDSKGVKFGKVIKKDSLIFDQIDEVAYCQIAKVASSTWCNHFIKLGKNKNY